MVYVFVRTLVSEKIMEIEETSFCEITYYVFLSDYKEKLLKCVISFKKTDF